VHRDLIEASPVQLLYRPGGKERPKDRTLGDTEIKALLANLDDVLRAPRMACAIRILLLTGQRRGELALARWRDIDLEAKTWTIPAAHSKTGGRCTERSEAHHSRGCAQPEIPCGARCPRIHAARPAPDVSTGLAKLGVADAVAERVLNHAAPGMAGVYNKHDYLEEMRLALDNWAAHLTGIEKSGT
jgi:integrase